MTATLSERISAAEAKLSGLRARRGSALLDGEVIDAGEVAALESEIAALQDAQGEQVRRERAAAGQARASHIAEQRARYRELEKKRDASLRSSEAGFREGIAGLEEAEAYTAEMASLAHQITGGVPSPLNSFDFIRRMSNNICAVLSRGKRGRIGNLELHHSMAKPNDVWADTEERLMKVHSQLIYGENAK